MFWDKVTEQGKVTEKLCIARPPSSHYGSDGKPLTEAHEARGAFGGRPYHTLLKAVCLTRGQPQGN